MIERMRLTFDVRSLSRIIVTPSQYLLVALAWPLTASAQQPADAGVNGTTDNSPGVGSVAAPVAQSAADAQRLDSVVQVVAGGFHTCIRRASGRVSCWGLNTSGQCGVPVYPDGEPNRRRATVLAPTEMESLSNAADLAAGSEHTCAILASGQIVCWGSNTNGQLALSAASSRDASPNTLVTLPDVNDAVELVAGHSHTCARRRTGHVICWGGCEQSPVRHTT